MNCKSVEKVLPELVAGELSESVAAAALEHISSCSTCAAEYAQYEKVHFAASRPWKMIDEPRNLVLILPETTGSRSPLFRLAFTVCALAAVLAALVLVPRVHTPTDRQSAKKPSPEKRTPVKRNIAQSARTGVSDHETMVRRPQVMPGTLSARPAESVRQYRADPAHRRSNSLRMAVKPTHGLKRAQRQAREASAPRVRNLTPKRSTEPAIVVASWIPNPPGQPAIVVESTNHATGEVSIHTVTYTDSGGKLESEIEFTPRPGDDWRDNL